MLKLQFMILLFHTNNSVSPPAYVTFSPLNFSSWYSWQPYHGKLDAHVESEKCLGNNKFDYMIFLIPTFIQADGYCRAADPLLDVHIAGDVQAAKDFKYLPDSL